MLKPGITREETLVVDETNIASRMGNEGMDVFSTPDMIGLFEMTCKRSVDPFLEEGQGTVGVTVNVQHLAATPVGMKVTCKSELVETDRNRLVFRVEAYDEVEMIGKGEHQRFIVSTESFLKGINAKKDKVK